jgi:uncharacterized protein (DUF58 family)
MTAVVLFTLGAYGVAAGSVTGEERAVAIGVFAFTLFAVGVIWPIVTLSRVQFTVSAPVDAMVGDDVPLRITVHGRVARMEMRVLDPPGRWYRISGPGLGTVTHLATRRGVYGAVRVQLRTSAPLGVFVRTRQARVGLAAPITIAPRPRVAAASIAPIPDAASVPAHLTGVGGGDAVRAVRPYVPGDPARFVHWPTSARRGELVVREHDPPTALGVALVVDLRGTEDEAEEAASIAAGVGRAALARGAQLVVATREEQGPVCAPVLDARALGHRLARAIGGVPADPPPGWPVQVVHA